MNTSQVHEIVSFSFVEGLDMEKQKSRMSKIGEFARSQRGFVQRACYFDSQAARWIDHVIWLDRACADTAMRKSMTDIDLAPVMADIVQSALAIGHYALVMQHPA